MCGCGQGADRARIRSPRKPGRLPGLDWLRKRVDGPRDGAEAGGPEDTATLCVDSLFASLMVMIDQTLVHAFVRWHRGGHELADTTWEMSGAAMMHATCIVSALAPRHVAPRPAPAVARDDVDVALPRVAAAPDALENDRRLAGQCLRRRAPGRREPPRAGRSGCSRRPSAAPAARCRDRPRAPPPSNPWPPARRARRTRSRRPPGRRKRRLRPVRRAAPEPSPRSQLRWWLIAPVGTEHNDRPVRSLWVKSVPQVRAPGSALMKRHGGEVRGCQAALVQANGETV